MPSNYGISWNEVRESGYGWFPGASADGRIGPASEHARLSAAHTIRALWGARTAPVLSLWVGRVSDEVDDGVWEELLDDATRVLVGSGGDMRDAIVIEKALYLLHKWDILLCHDAYVLVAGADPDASWRMFAAYHYRRRVELFDDRDAARVRERKSVRAVLALP